MRVESVGLLWTLIEQWRQKERHWQEHPDDDIPGFCYRRFADKLEAALATLPQQPDEVTLAIGTRIREQMGHAGYYVRPESGVLRFCILPMELKALLKAAGIPE